MDVKKCIRKWTAVMMSTLIAVSGFTVLPQAGEQEAEKTDLVGEIMAEMTLREKAGQMILADFRTWNENPQDENSEDKPVIELPEEVREAISRDSLGGIILFAENCAENEQTARLVNAMQEANQASGKPHPIPLLIAADQEGGAVTRLGQGTKWIGNMAMTATGDPENAAAAAGCMGQELAALGINTDFAPVLDVNNNPGNPVIGTRSFSDDPEMVREYGVSFLEGLKQTGTITALKHFPGHGDVATDSHTGFPVLEKTYEELKECELIPFQAAIEAGADMVMTAHIQYPKIETGTYLSSSTGEKVYLPATLSHTILTDILRGDMGFEGVIVSDALNMAAISENFEIKDVCSLAVEAGIDLFLMPVPVKNPDSLKGLEEFIGYLCELVENGTVPESRIDESVRRILTLKEKHGLLNEIHTDLTDEQLQKASEIPGSREHHDMEWEMMQKSVTLLKNEGDLLPLTAKAGEKVLVLYSAASRVASAEFARLRLVREGLLPEDVSFEAMVFGRETSEDCIKAAKEADIVIAVTTVFGANELNPGAEDGADLAVLDQVMETVHGENKKLILVSSMLPYDVARFTDADAILVTYGSTPMNELPGEKEAYSVNIPAAICGIFGEYEFTGRLPIAIPKLDQDYQFTEEILFPCEVLPAGTTETSEEADTAMETESAAEENVKTASLPEAGWQAQVTFPDWKGYPDDTLAMNSMFSFFGCHGQGTLYVQPKEEVKSFRMYVNGKLVDTTLMTGGGTYPVDISALAEDGKNTIQVSNILPFESTVTVSVPYPEILPGDAGEEGISPLALEMISSLIESDIENGFSSAQLAVVRNGRLVYENAWGKTSSWLPDGSINPDSPAVTTETMYDLASVTKMFSVNYALQKLVTDEALKLDERITTFMGDGFADDTILISDDAEDQPDLETIKAWKRELTIRDLLRHQGGFPADPRYPAPYYYKKDLAEGESYPENRLYAGNGGDEATRKATIEAICKTPLDYEPGTRTVYSDVDYMILGLVVEQVTGKDLNTWLKETFWEPMGLTHITYNPLKEGFEADDCAATELNGNTRDGYLDYPGYRTYTLQGEVHDEKAYYSMQGISGHAGLFANASDLAKLASVMLCGGYGEHRFFSKSVMDQFTAPKQEDASNWGLGWWRQGDAQRVWYFGTQADSDTIGHQGWTGTLVMIDPERRLVVAYLTNKINSRITDKDDNPDKFDGNWYTASTLGFVPQILSMGMDSDQDISAQLLDLCADMVVESMKLVPKEKELSGTHPSAKNVQSKRAVFEQLAEKAGDSEQVRSLQEGLTATYEKVRSDHKRDFNEVLLQVIAETEDGGGYYTGTEKTEELEKTAWEGMDAAVTVNEENVQVDMSLARPSFCSSACYMALLKALSIWDTDGQISPQSWACLKPYTVEGAAWPVQEDGVGCWGRANANGPGMAVLAAQLGAGTNIYLAPAESFATGEEYLASWDQLKAGDFLKLFWNDRIGGDSETDTWESGHMVVYLDRVENYDEKGERDDILYYWSSNGSGYMPDKGYGIGKTRLSDVYRAVATRITYAGAFDNAKEIAPDNTDTWLHDIMDSNLASEEELISAIS